MLFFLRVIPHTQICTTLLLKEQFKFIKYHHKGFRNYRETSETPEYLIRNYYWSKIGNFNQNYINN